MNARTKWLSAVAALCALFLLAKTPRGRGIVHAQARKTVMMTHLYTGPDGQTHAEEIEAPFPANDVFKMMQVNGAELHRYSPGYVNDWHPAPRRQYVITLSGRGEVELASGQKITSGPGHIEFAEDTTGKGHITRVVGNEDRITLQLPVAGDASH